MCNCEPENFNFSNNNIISDLTAEQILITIALLSCLPPGSAVQSARVYRLPHLPQHKPQDLPHSVHHSTTPMQMLSFEVPTRSTSMSMGLYYRNRPLSSSQYFHVRNQMLLASRTRRSDRSSILERIVGPLRYYWQLSTQLCPWAPSPSRWTT